MNSVHRKGRQADRNVFRALGAGCAVADQGIFRSDTKGARWIRVSDDGHNFGGPAAAATFVGDPRVFGRIYMGMNARDHLRRYRARGTVIPRT